MVRKQEQVLLAFGKTVKDRRIELGLTQEEFAEKAGVALTVVRKIEQDKENLSLSKVNQVLMMFGHSIGPVKSN